MDDVGQRCPYRVAMMTAVAGPVRLVLIDDHEMVIEGLKAKLGSGAQAPDGKRGHR